MIFILSGEKKYAGDRVVFRIFREWFSERLKSTQINGILEFKGKSDADDSAEPGHPASFSKAALYFLSAESMIPVFDARRETTSFLLSKYACQKIPSRSSVQSIVSP